MVTPATLFAHGAWSLLQRRRCAIARRRRVPVSLRSAFSASTIANGRGYRLTRCGGDANLRWLASTAMNASRDRSNPGLHRHLRRASAIAATSAHADSGNDIIELNNSGMPSVAGRLGRRRLPSPPPKRPTGFPGPSAPISISSMPVVVTLGGDRRWVLRTLPPATSTARTPRPSTSPPVVAPPRIGMAAASGERTVHRLRWSRPRPPLAPPPVAAVPAPPPQAIAPPTTRRRSPAMPAPPAALSRRRRRPLHPKPAFPASPVAAVTLGGSDIIDHGAPPSACRATSVPGLSSCWHGHVGGQEQRRMDALGGSTWVRAIPGPARIRLRHRRSGLASGVFSGSRSSYQRPFDIDLGFAYRAGRGCRGSRFSGLRASAVLVLRPLSARPLPGICCNVLVTQQSSQIDWFGCATGHQVTARRQQRARLRHGSQFTAAADSAKSRVPLD